MIKLESAHRHWFILVIIAALLCFGFLFSSIFKNIKIRLVVEDCMSIQSKQIEIDCINQRVIAKKILTKNIEAALYVFSIAQNTSESFGEDCHARMHELADMAYYKIFYSDFNIFLETELPPEIVSCYHAFFHGYIEHLIQNNSDPVFATNICQALYKRFYPEMRNIRNHCYDGAGHGFQLAHIENTPIALRGDAHAFVDKPISQCEKLSIATRNEKNACVRAVFTSLATIVKNNYYGFNRTDYADLFLICDTFESIWRLSCHEGTRQAGSLLDRKSHLTSIFDSLGSIEEKIIQDTVFISELKRNMIGRKNEYKEILSFCNSLEPAKYARCIYSIISGIFASGEYGKEYKTALALCVEPTLIERGAGRFCYGQIMLEMNGYYTPDIINHVIKLFPSEMSILYKERDIPIESVYSKI